MIISDSRRFRNALLLSVPIWAVVAGAIAQPGTQKPASRPTYYGRVANIMENRCVECHRSGGVAPFALNTMKDVVSHSATMVAVVEKGNMPPWFAAAPKKGEKSCWANDRSLSPEEKSDLVNWLKSNHPAGNPADAPTPKKYDETWQIGKPDLVVQIPNPIKIKADGYMPYQMAYVAVDGADDRWVQSLEVLPTARAVVHHVLVFVLPELGQGRKSRFGGVLSRGIIDESAGFFAAYVPGNAVLSYPDGFAKKLPKRANLLFQIHYTPNGKETVDQTKLGIVFAKQEPKHQIETYGIANRFISIPPGDSAHVETANVKPPVPVTLIGFSPHMHVRGKAFKYELVTSDGQRKTLLDVPKYDFNWQLYYKFKEPFAVLAGAQVVATAVYDNSKQNPSNPDSTRTVPWGPQTYDEMMLGYVEYYQTNAPVQAASNPGTK